VRITKVEAIELRLPEDQIEEKCSSGQDALIVKIHTDEGLTGIGEIDSSSRVAKAAIEAPFSHTVTSGLARLLVGENPLNLRVLQEKMYQATFYYGRRGVVIHAMGGIDMALWDLAGKILNLPVCRLLGGPFRDQIRMTLNSQPRDPLDPASCREWAARLRADPNGWNCFKIGYMRLTNQTPDRLA